MDAKLRDCVFEIGTEEIPARFMRKAMEDVLQIAEKMFASERLTYEAIKVYGTPRRLVLYVEKLADRQPDLEKEMRGPSAKVAFDADGNPTKALMGFAKSCNVDLDKIVVKETESGQYAYALSVEKGGDVSAVLSGIFPKIVTSLTFPKTMRWGSSDFRFVRPIRWFLALFGDEIVDFEVEGTKSSNLTSGHRTINPGMHEVKDAESFSDKLREVGIIVDHEERKNIISSQLERLAAEIKGVPVVDADLLEEVTFILEWPTGFVGDFDPSYLDIPEACITTPMQEHQRYFPVRDEKGALMPNFVAFRNGDERSLQIVKAGNERVLRARLADAKFFYDEDMSKPFLERTSELEMVMFQESLGNMADKCARDEKLAKFLIEGSEDAGWKACDLETVELLARNCKTDLVTSVVREFPELQGIMGSEYMIRQGYDPSVAVAIAEHYMPRFAEDELPKTSYGSLLAIADKIDTVVGYFALNMIPTGSADPYSLRRQTLGVVLISLQHPAMVSLVELVKMAYSVHKEKNKLKLGLDETVGEVMKFIGGRIENLLLEKGISHDVTEAVCASGFAYPTRILASAKKLEELKSNSAFSAFVSAFSRVKNIAVHAQSAEFHIEEMSNPADKLLAERYNETLKILENTDSVEKEIEVFLSLTDDINKFFDEVMVMDEDLRVRANRLGLLKSIEVMCTRAADFSKVQI